MLTKAQIGKLFDLHRFSVWIPNSSDASFSKVLSILKAVVLLLNFKVIFAMRIYQVRSWWYLYYEISNFFWTGAPYINLADKFAIWMGKIIETLCNCPWDRIFSPLCTLFRLIAVVFGRVLKRTKEETNTISPLSSSVDSIPWNLNIYHAWIHHKSDREILLRLRFIFAVWVCYVKPEHASSFPTEEMKWLKYKNVWIEDCLSISNK